ncbi:MAG: ABC transporter ATP-binding protein [Bacteroidales bacterium]|nr:ABC transporter ATP-binding protein [Bacteroidales bacterium]
MIVLEAFNLKKKYAGEYEFAVNDFNANILKGEIVALLGESGCGKTTILRMIAGFEKPDDGILKLNSQKIASKDFMTAPEKRGVGIVFQDYALFPHKTVNENILFGLFRLSKDKAKERLIEMIALTGLNGLEQRYPHELSGGQQQRVALARALAPDPSILLLDEPFSNLDAMRKNELRFELRDIIRKAGTTAIFVTHDTRDVLAIADRVFVLKKGVTIQQGSPEEVYRKPADSYVASFFGKTNIIAVDPNSSVLEDCFGLCIPKNQHLENLASIRPRAFKIAQENTEGAFEAKVLEQLYFGEFLELICETENQKLQLIVHADPDFVVSSRKIWLRVHPEDVTYVKH